VSDVKYKILLLAIYGTGILWCTGFTAFDISIHKNGLAALQAGYAAYFAWRLRKLLKENA
jgi:hypothetical protein